MNCVEEDIYRKMVYAKKRAFEEPAWFLTDILHEDPDVWQVKGIEVIADSFRYLKGLPTKYNHKGVQRLTVKSCHGPGKTHWLGQVMHWWNFCFYGKVVCTAPKEKQLKTRLWPRYRKILRGSEEWYKEMIVVNATDIKIANDDDWGCIGETASDPENMAGYHDTPQLFLVDEGSARVLDPMYPVIEGALTTPGSFLCMIGNPTRTTGEFWASHNKRGTKELYYQMHIRPEDSRFVDEKWVNNMIAKYGKNSPIVAVRVLGKFATAEDNQLILMDWLEDAKQKDVVDDGSHPTIRITIDVADGGEDETIITVAYLYDTFTLLYRMFRYSFPQRTATDDIVNETKRVAERVGFDKGRDDIVVDSIGVGTGVASNLITDGYSVVRFKGGETENIDTKNYRNHRVRSYLVYRDKLLEGSIYYDDDFCSEEDWEDYEGQMMTIRTKPGIERNEDLVSKQDMRTQGIKSPDMPDGTSMVFTNMSPEMQSSSFTPLILGTMESAKYDY